MKFANLFRTLLLVAAMLALGGCGGGGGGGSSSTGGSSNNGGGSTGNQTTAPTADAFATPTAVIASSQVDATNLLTAGQSGASAMLQVSNAAGLPFGVQLAPPTGVTNTVDDSSFCTSGGTLSLTTSFANQSGTPTAGDSAIETFNNCSFVFDGTAMMVNGLVTVNFTRYNSSSDFALTEALSNITGSYGGVSAGPYNLTANIDCVNNGCSFSYSGSTWTVMGNPVITVNGNAATISSGTVRVNYGSGWVNVTITNWVFDATTGQASAGTLTITAANGNNAVVTATGGGHYTVAITVNGTNTNYYY